MEPCQCLMIKTKDNRKFFTHEKNLAQLLEFSKTFKAEISVVKVHESEIMDLEELAPAICDTNRVNKKPEYELVEVKIPILPRQPRAKILDVAKKIKDYVLLKFSNGETVSLKDLKKKFKRYALSTPALCNHIRRVKAEIESKGHKVCKVGAGAYQVVK